MNVLVVRYSDRPELWDRLAGLGAEVWPEYNLHGEFINRYWGRLYDDFPEWQFVLFDADARGSVRAQGSRRRAHGDQRARRQDPAA
jgi:hypothetical protein